jgi:hypothetical protein
MWKHLKKYFWFNYATCGPPRIYASRRSRLALQGVEVGSNYFHHSSASRKSRRKGNPVKGGCNWTTLFLGDINTRTWAPGWGSFESKRVKCGHESCGILTWEWMRWRGPAATVNDKPILPSERLLHKGYDRRCSIEENVLAVRLKGLVAKTNWFFGKRPVVK